MSRTEVIGWCPPLHHNVEGAADPSSCTLQDPFVAVIIGASRGIGAHMAKSFAQAGASGIIITGRDAAALGNAKSEVEAVAKNKTLKIEAIICDVLIDSDITKLAEKVGLLFGRIDCLILNSGKPVKLIEQPDGTRDWPKGIVDSNLEDLRDVMNTNLTAPMTLLHFLLPLVVATGDGPQTVIIVSSSAANHTDTKTVPIGYVMSKFANARLAEYVHESYSKKGVSVVAIQPGSVMTEGAKPHIPAGKGWEKVMIDDVGLAGSLCVWLSKERRPWLSGRYIDSRWDLEELQRRQGEIVAKDKLKYRLVL